MTEAELFDALSARYPSPEYALIPQATEGTGWRSTRWLDAVSVSLWPSRGITFHGFEIKSARYDWLRELKKPEKGQALFDHLDFFSIVAGDADIVQDGELPQQWGLLVWDGAVLKQKVAAPRLHEGELSRTMTREFLAGLCRRIDQQYVTGKVQQLAQKAREQADKDAEERVRRRMSYGQDMADKLSLAAFAEGLGFSGRIDEVEARRYGQIARRLSEMEGKHGALPELRQRLKMLDKTLKEIDALLQPTPESAVSA